MDPTRPTHYREDFAAIDGVVRTDEGYVFAPATLAVPGVYPYRDSSTGQIVRELVDADVLEASAEAWAHRPVTDGHPAKMVDANTIGEVAVGHVTDGVRVDAGRLIGRLAVTHRRGLDAIDRGARQVSCGSLVALDETPGVWTAPDGRQVPYDKRQTRRVPNHVAIVHRGRHGAEASIRLDSFADVEGAAVMVDQSETDAPPKGQPREDSSMKITINGKTYDLSDEKFDGAALQSDIEAVEKARDDEKARADAATGRVDALEADIATTRKQRDEHKARADKAEGDTLTAEQLDAHVDERIRLLGGAAAVGLDVAEARKLGTKELGKAIVAKRYPDLRLDEATDDRIAGALDVALADVGTDHVANLAAGLTRPTKRTDAGETKSDPKADWAAAATGAKRAS